MTDTSKPPVAYASADAALQAVQAARQAGDATAALAAAEAAARMAPDRYEAWVSVAACAARANDPVRADAAQLRAIETTSDPLQIARVKADRAWTLMNMGRPTEAVALAREVAPALEREPIARSIIAATLATGGFSDEALPHLQAAVDAFPTRPDLHFNLAVGYRTLGRLDEAQAALDETLRLSPGFLPAYEIVGLLRTATEDRNEVSRLKSARARLHPGRDAARIDYALFKQLDDLGRNDEAWAMLTRASAATAPLGDWSAEADEALADAMITAFPRPTAPAPATGSPRPIFVLGLPRTGTTLVERIFAAHTGVRALGELETLGRALKQVGGFDFGSYLDARVGTEAAGIDWTAVGAQYRREVAGLAEGAEVVVDKLPLNVWYAGAIAAALPDARMVHVRRDPMDTLFGAYKMMFGPAFDWSYRFEDMAAHYRAYRRVTDHWRATLGEAFIDLDYEALVRDPAAVIPGLLKATGLSFEEACLEPHRAAGTVFTPSATQVREPISDRNIGAWRKYAAQLEPLRALLQADGFVDADGNAV